MQIILGDCLLKLKELKDNSVDSVVTDPPYGISFMGKHWDYDVPKVEVWKEVLRVLKPGGHALVACGTRTQHRMAVNLEDAGFEIRDIVAWVYGSGFPKSLNIGKAVDKLQGNEREIIGNRIAHDITGGALMEATIPELKKEISKVQIDITKGSSPYKGWGTALKPSMELWTLCRKPLEEKELDIANTISRQLNKPIIWRIRNVKNAEKQKTNPCSIQTQQQKMVEVSAEIVETKENESVGKQIQKLIANICESGIQGTGKRKKIQVIDTILKIKTEYQDTGKNINTNESQKSSQNMVENVSVVEKQDLSSLPLTTQTEAEENTENQLKTQTSTLSLKKQDTQKTDTDYSAQIATSQWVCMDIAHIITISFEGKEYDFYQLADGSLVWNENLEPYRKYRKFNVAENVLKYGTGGINIDGCRVETEEISENLVKVEIDE